MIEPRFIPPPMPVDPGIGQWQAPRRITAGQSIAVLALVLGAVLLVGMTAQGLFTLARAMHLLGIDG